MILNLVKPKFLVMKKCLLFFALFVLAVMLAAIIDDDERADLIEEVSQGEEEIDKLAVYGG